MVTPWAVGSYNNELKKLFRVESEKPPSSCHTCPALYLACKPKLLSKCFISSHYYISRLYLLDTHTHTDTPIRSLKVFERFFRNKKRKRKVEKMHPKFIRYNITLHFLFSLHSLFIQNNSPFRCTYLHCTVPSQMAQGYTNVRPGKVPHCLNSQYQLCHQLCVSYIRTFWN